LEWLASVKQIEVQSEQELERVLGLKLQVGEVSEQESKLWAVGEWLDWLELGSESVAGQAWELPDAVEFLVVTEPHGGLFRLLLADCGL